jgi:hypothetical protein
MQTTDNFLLTAAEINEGMQILKRKVLSFLEDAEILARNNGQSSHYVGLYLFALEEFGKLLLLEDSLQSNSVNGQYSVDKGIFGKGQDLAKRRQAHKLKVDRALKTLPSDCGSRCKSKIIKNALNAPDIPNSNVISSDTETVPITEEMIAIVKDTQAQSSPFEISDRIKGFFIDWDDNNRRWDSSLQGGSFEEVSPCDFLEITAKCSIFVKSYC